MSTDEQPIPTPPQSVPGQVLKARREALGWSVEQVADQLKLAPRQVVALEEGDYESLPPAAVVRGFVRGYAKVMKIDAAPLVAGIPVDAAAAAADASAVPRRERAASMPRVKYPSHGKRARFPAGAVVLVVVVAGGLAAAWQFGMLGLDRDAPAGSTTTEVVPPALPPANGGVAAPALPSAANGTAAGTTALQSPTVPLISVPPVQSTDPAAAAATTTTPAATAAQPLATPPAAGAATPATQPPAAAPQPAVTAPAAAAGANTLVLNVKQDSWIEVRGAGGAQLSRLVKAGTTETVNLDGPATLIVGNPAGVDATLRGAPLALRKLPNSNVSRQKIQ